jgi:flagellar hook assembly protein FlgD
LGLAAFALRPSLALQTLIGHGFRSYAVNTDGEEVAPVFALYTNYPNPFNPSTNISFSIPSPANVKLTVYNVKGQKVKELINDTMDMGIHTVQWDGTDQ